MRKKAMGAAQAVVLIVSAAQEQDDVQRRRRAKAVGEAEGVERASRSSAQEVDDEGEEEVCSDGDV